MVWSRNLELFILLVCIDKKSNLCQHKLAYTVNECIKCLGLTWLLTIYVLKISALAHSRKLCEALFPMNWLFFAFQGVKRWYFSLFFNSSKLAQHLKIKIILLELLSEYQMLVRMRAAGTLTL